MNSNWQWFNRSLPVTLVNAQMLLYITAVFSLIGGGPFVSSLQLLFTLGLIAGAAGIANEQKWGYGLALVVAVTVVVLQLVLYRFDVLKFPFILGFMLDAVLVPLLVHPLSRNHQRVWFK